MRVREALLFIVPLLITGGAYAYMVWKKKKEYEEIKKEAKKRWEERTRLPNVVFEIKKPYEGQTLWVAWDPSVEVVIQNLSEWNVPVTLRWKIYDEKGNLIDAGFEYIALPAYALKKYKFYPDWKVPAISKQRRKIVMELIYAGNLLQRKERKCWVKGKLRVFGEVDHACLEVV